MKNLKVILPAFLLITLFSIPLVGNTSSEDNSEYFKRLNETLKKDGFGRPAMLLDLGELDKNLQTLRSKLPSHINYRVVVKSLPSLKLVEYVMQKMQTNKLMVFHQPFLNQVVEKFPSADVLLGKPMPVAAAERFYARANLKISKLQWLIDTEERLNQYLEMAKNRGLKLHINLEINVGLNRGGFSEDESYLRALKIIEANPNYLSFTGLMGYEAHVGKIPGIIERAETTFRKSQDRYKEFIEIGKRRTPSLFAGQLTFNGAGSGTLKWHKKGSIINDAAVGSALMKPSDFDKLEGFLPAIYIATPILKVLDGTKLPGLERISGLWPIIDSRRQLALFIYGGGWMADPVYPEKAVTNPLFGKSTNQAIYNAPKSSGVKADDYLFLRPTQSEFVMLQFGDLVIVRNSQIIDHWPVLEQRD